MNNDIGGLYVTMDTINRKPSATVIVIIRGKTLVEIPFTYEQFDVVCAAFEEMKRRMERDHSKLTPIKEWIPRSKSKRRSLFWRFVDFWIGGYFR